MDFEIDVCPVLDLRPMVRSIRQFDRARYENAQKGDTDSLISFEMQRLANICVQAFSAPEVCADEDLFMILGNLRNEMEEIWPWATDGFGQDVTRFLLFPGSAPCPLSRAVRDKWSLARLGKGTPTKEHLRLRHRRRMHKDPFGRMP